MLAAKGYGRECLLEALTTLEPAPKSPVVVEALAAAVAGASDKEERLVTAALRAPVPPRCRRWRRCCRRRRRPIEDRARAARVLGALDDARAAERC